MSERDFRKLLEARWASGHFVCVGLDTDFAKLPLHLRDETDRGESVMRFNEAIIRTTAGKAGAYKLNSAFYEAEGGAGIRALQMTIQFIGEVAPGVPVILDAKRADIGNTNDAYVKFAFDYCGADAVTVHPYLGREALKPFLERAEKGIIVLCRTSNPGAGEFQDLKINGSEPLFLHVARKVYVDWNKHGNCGLVVGATYPDELKLVRENVGDLPLLIPGIGKQGGDLKLAVTNGRNSANTGFVLNSSSGIIYASKGEDFAEKAGEELDKLNAQIAQVMKEQVRT